MVQPLWHLAWMIWGNTFGQKWYGDWDKVRISIRTLNQTWSYKQSHWPEHFISIWSRKGKTLCCGCHKMTSDNKREGWWKDANARSKCQNSTSESPPCPVKLPSDVPSLGSAGLSDRYIIEPRRGVWTDCLLLPLLFLMGSSQQAATEPFVFHQSPLLSSIPPPLSLKNPLWRPHSLPLSLLDTSVHALFF